MPSPRRLQAHAPGHLTPKTRSLQQNSPFASCRNQARTQRNAWITNVSHSTDVGAAVAASQCAAAAALLHEHYVHAGHVAHVAHGNLAMGLSRRPRLGAQIQPSSVGSGN